ncbi:perlucin-like protein [Mytilus trossulus]|uniref:perlucin-like protein n=1 Tax=Mytilus trossulus TaxID=6551 RepID=UPI003005EA69
MGATDFKEGEWRWTNDLSKVQYSNWESRQPSGGAGHDCAHFWHSSGYKWDDTSCKSIGFGYVCERAHGSNCLPYSKQFKRRK